MADSSLIMKLSLVDTASPQLQGFINSLKTLQASVGGLNASLASSTASINATGASAAAATASFASAASSAKNLANDLHSVGSGGNTAAAGVKNSSSAASSATGAFNSLATSLRSALGAYMGFQGVKALVHMSDQVESTDARMKFVTGSTEAAKEATDQLYASAQKLQAPYESTAKTFSRLLPAVKAMGGGTNEAKKMTEALIVSAKSFGATTQEAAGAALQFSQAIGSGRLNGEELRALLENAAPLMAGLVKELNKSPEALKKLGVEGKLTVGMLKQLGTDGKLTSDLVANTMVAAHSEIMKSADAIPNTISGSLTRAQNALERLFRETNNGGGVFRDLAGFINDGVNAMDKFTDSLKYGGEGVAQFREHMELMGSITMPIASGAWDLFKVAAEEAMAFSRVAVEGFRDVFIAFSAFFMDESQLTGNAAKDWSITVDAAVEFVSRAFRNFMALITIIVEGFKTGLVTMVTAVDMYFTKISDYADALANFLATVLTGDIKGAVSGFNDALDKMEKTANAKFQRMAEAAERSAARMASAMAVLANGGAVDKKTNDFDAGGKGGWEVDKVVTKDAIMSGGTPPKKNKGGGGRSADSMAASIEKENARFEKEKLALELKGIEDLYKDHQIGIEQYFTVRAEAIKKGFLAEIEALQKERDILAKDPAKNADKILKVDHQIEIAQKKELIALSELEMNKKKALQSLDKEGLSIQEKLENITKSASNAKIALLDQEYEKKRKILELNGQLAQAAMLDQLHIKEVAKVRYDDQMKQINLISAREKTAEMQAQSDKKRGYMNTAEANQTIIEAKRAQGEAELVVLDALRAQAEIIGDPMLIENIKQMTIAAEDLAETLDEGAQKFKDTMQSSIEGALNDLMSGKFSFKKFIDGIVKDINKQVAKSLSESITNGLFGGKDGKGGMFGNLFGNGKDGGNFITNLFGGDSKKKPGAEPSGYDIFGSAMQSNESAQGLIGGDQQGALGAAAKAAEEGLKNMTNNGVEAATQSLVQQVTQGTVEQTASQLATQALQQLAQAAQQASSALQSVGSGSGGGGGGLGGLFGGGGGGGSLTFMDSIGGMFSFDVGADNIPRDMIAKIHKGEMILPAGTADKVRGGALNGAGDSSMQQTNHFHIQGNYDKRTQDQIAKTVGGAMQRANRRNG